MRQRLTLFSIVALVVLAGCTGGVGSPGGAATVETASDAPATTSDTTTVESVEGTLEIHFINVGQGDSTLVIGPTGETMLIDTGDFRDDGAYVIDYLESQDIDRIDALVSSHADADHIGGNAAVIDHFETQKEGVGAVYDPGVAASTATYERYLDAVEEHDVPLYRTLAGDEIPLEGADVSVLGPPQPYLADGERNENSIVLRLAFGRTSVLLTGDAGPAEEPYLVDTYGEALDVTLLKAGHHGSSSSTSARLLDVTTPAVTVVSSAYDSRYGHPHEEVLDRLSQRAVPTYWTGTHGTVVATSDGAVIEVATQAAATTQPQGLRSDAPLDPETQGPVVVREAYQATDGDESEGSTTAGVRIEVTEIHADAAGDDRENLGDEYVVLTNRGEESVDLSGWVLTDESGAQYTFPAGSTVAPGDSVRVVTGSGTDTASRKYWGADRPIWNNDGDTVRLVRAEGGVVVEVSY